MNFFGFFVISNAVRDLLQQAHSRSLTAFEMTALLKKLNFHSDDTLTIFFALRQTGTSYYILLIVDYFQCPNCNTLPINSVSAN